MSVMYSSPPAPVVNVSNVLFSPLLLPVVNVVNVLLPLPAPVVNVVNVLPSPPLACPWVIPVLLPVGYSRLAPCWLFSLHTVGYSLPDIPAWALMTRRMLRTEHLRTDGEKRRD